KTAIKQTFTVSVSKASGPVAAAIAVGNYTQCLYKEMDVLAETMLTSDEFEKTLEKQTSFVEMLSIENYLETQKFIDLQNVTTKAELMNWLEHNIAYTKFTSIAEASNLFDALEKQTVAMTKKFVSPRVEMDVAIFWERTVLLLERKIEDDESKRGGWRCVKAGIGLVGAMGFAALATPTWVGVVGAAWALGWAIDGVATNCP
ncbi:MAG: hypothetical protein LBH22_01220, partial [Bacteroidales bacterium]|nr:hypothetical protein [Bacteroidales bacterium]